MRTLRLLFDKFAHALKTPGARYWLIIALVSGALTALAQYVAQTVAPNAAAVVSAVILILLPAIFVLIGYERSRSDDPVRKLFDQSDAVKAPYLLSCAAALHREDRVSDRDKRLAFEELTEQLRSLKDENQYIQAVLTDVAKNAVWAICGRKTHKNARSFYLACKASFKAGNYVERVFLPPSTVKDASSIQTAIEDYHFPTGMLVRALCPDQDADDVRHSHRFPLGFGMTIIGERKRPAMNPPHDPVSHSAVLIHWGGVDLPTTHFGVVLTEAAWLEYFWNLFERMRGVTEIANPPDRPPPTWAEFTRKYPDYNP